MQQIDRGERLVLRQHPEGAHHELAGRPISNGDILEVRGAAGWVRGRYGWSNRVEFWPALTPDPNDRLDRDRQATLRRFNADSPCRWPTTAEG